MCRSSALLLGAAWLVLLQATVACRAVDPVPVRRANLVLISIDTLRADRLNSYGYDARSVSPEIDRLARDGVLFETHISAAPWTTPAHLSLLTALSPSAHGVTGRISKGWNRLRNGREFERLSGEHLTLAELLSAHSYATAAFTGGITMDPRLGFDQGFGTYDTTQAKLSGERLSSVTEWIESHRDAPFFLFWHTFEVHAPYLHGDFLGEVLSEDKASKVRAALGVLGDEPGVSLGVQPGRKALIRNRVFSLEVCSALYDGGVRSADRAVGTVVASLERVGLYDSTLVVVTSDHGEQLGETTGPDGLGNRNGTFYNAHGTTMYEEMLRVPLILKLPLGEGAGRRVPGVSRTIDVMPTVLDVLNIPGPVAMQGRSLRPLWEGTERTSRIAFSEAVNGKAESKSLRSERHKYILSFDGDKVEERGRAGVPEHPDVVEFYDLLADPAEQHNLMIHPVPGSVASAAVFDAELRRVAEERHGVSELVRLDADALEKLEALGYVEGDSSLDREEGREGADGP